MEDTTNVIKIPWLNEGAPFELKKMPLGGSEEMLRYRAEKGEVTAEDLKKYKGSKGSEAAMQLLQIQVIMVKWTLKRCFPKTDINDIERNLKEQMSFDELVEIAGKVSRLSPRGEPVERAKDEKEKK